MPTEQEIVKEIKKKEELQGLADSIVLDSLRIYILKRKISITGLKPSETKQLVKDIRAELRKYTGRFQVSAKDKLKLLEKEDFHSLLQSHASSKERSGDYAEIKRIISKLGVKSILDLGCGLNPLALATPDITYYASDINELDLKIIDRFFKINNIPGNTITYDLRKIGSDLPEADLCIIMKVFDVLEKKGHKLAEKIILSVKSKYFLISFSTKTLSGKPMNHPQRGWIELLLTRLGYSFEFIKLRNEVVYLAKRN